MKIVYVDMKKATGNPAIGVRPVVVLWKNNGIAKVMKITSRNKGNKFHAHMNNYVISGFCCCSEVYYINSDFVDNGTFMRNCTRSEVEEINKTYSYAMKNGYLRKYTCDLPTVNVRVRGIEGRWTRKESLTYKKQSCYVLENDMNEHIIVNKNGICLEEKY